MWGSDDLLKVKPERHLHFARPIVRISTHATGRHLKDAAGIGAARGLAGVPLALHIEDIESIEISNLPAFSEDRIPRIRSPRRDCCRSAAVNQYGGSPPRYI